MLAAIDVGTNTVRLLIGEVGCGDLLPRYYGRHITRLGGGFSEQEGLSPAARERTLDALKEFAAICASWPVTRLRAVGTAAFRRAVNGAAFAAEIGRATGITLEVIDGLEEAQLTASGVLCAVRPQPECALIIDIGGGSTEFVLVRDGRVAWKTSRPLGVVRLCEDVSAPDAQAGLIAEVVDAVRDELAGRLADDGRPVQVIGTAGTVTTLAAVDLGMTEYDWRRINNYRLPLARLQAMRRRLAPLTPAQREAIPGLEPGRGDLILPGLDIVLHTLQAFACEVLTVSDFGILEGTLLAMAAGATHPDSD